MAQKIAQELLKSSSHRLASTLHSMPALNTEQSNLVRAAQQKAAEIAVQVAPPLALPCLSFPFLSRYLLLVLFLASLSLCCFIGPVLAVHYWCFLATLASDSLLLLLLAWYMLHDWTGACGCCAFPDIAQCPICNLKSSGLVSTKAAAFAPVMSNRRRQQSACTAGQVANTANWQHARQRQRPVM